MLQKDKLHGYYETYDGIFKSIDEALANNRIIACLILIYAAIDGFSFLADRSSINRTSTKIFEAWVKKWMLSNGQLPCNEKDLFAARCSLIHLQNSESDLSFQNKAKRILYAYHHADKVFLEGVIKHGKIDNKFIVIKVEDLISSLKDGIEVCITHIFNDPSWTETFINKAVKQYSTIPYDPNHFRE